MPNSFRNELFLIYLGLSCTCFAGFSNMEAVSGAFAFIRHPISANFSIFIGIALLCLSGMFLILAVIKFWKAFLEEKSQGYRIKSTQENLNLANECESLCQDIADFIFERDTTSPCNDMQQRVVGNGENTFYNIANFNNQTKVLYAHRFGARISCLYEKMISLGHKPASILVLGDDAFRDQKKGKLLHYADLLKSGQMINDIPRLPNEVI